MKEMIFKYIPILIPCGIGIGVVNVRLDKIECENKDIKLEQRIGRIIREHPEKQVPMIIDFWLSGPIVARQQQKRLAWYQQRGYYLL